MTEDWGKETNQEFNIQKLFSNKLTVAVILLFFAGLFLLTFGAGMFLFRGSTPKDDIKIITAEENESVGTIIVHVDGAVNEPGVYELEMSSRVNDLVAVAGGLSEDADTEKVNLAAKLVDGQKVYIASYSDAVSPGSVVGQTNSGLININTASEAQLDTLPGIGPVTAGKIIAARPFGSADELLSKKAVGKSTYGKIKDLVTVY